MKKIIILLLLSFTTLSAQFGKNKVQYQTFDWQYIETDHFDIYFHEGGLYLAKFAAIAAEDALVEIETALNYDLKKRISIIVFNTHNQFQQNNIIFSFLSENTGGVTQLFKNRIVLPFQGDYSQYRHVIHHELVHGVLNDMFHGGTLQSSISQGGFFIPLWLNEGLCEYLSNYGMDTKTDVFMRDITISEDLPPLNRISGYGAYRIGQTFYWFVEKKYGKEKVGDFINKLNIHKNVDVAFKSSFDMDIEEFNDMFEREIKKIYWPDLEVFQSLPEYAIRVTNREKMNNFYNSAPAISPNGEKMAFISEEGGVLVIAIMDDINDQSSVRTLISSFRQQDFEDLNMLAPGISWNPTGDKLAISAKSGGQDAVFITDAKTGEYTKLTFGIKSIESVVWSPDGEKLAFIGSEEEQSDIYVYSFDGQKLSKATNDIFSDHSPKWSPDSKSIYFISDRKDITNNKLKSNKIDMWSFDYKSADIYNIELENGNIKRLTSTPEYRKTSLAISKDNKKLLFVSDDNGIGNLYELNLETNKKRPLTNSLQEITQLSLSDDNSKVLFGTQIEGGYDIFRLNYPFDRKLDIETLPLTDFRKSQQKKDSLILEIENKAKEEESESELIAYGNFKVDFDSQELVKPNDQAIKGEDKSVSKADTNFVVKDYKIKFTPDIVLGSPGYSTFFGFQGVAQMLFSDELGNHQLFFRANLLIDIRNSNFFGAYNYLGGIVDYQFSGFHNAGFVAGTRDSLLRFRSYGLGVSGQYPLDLFNRMEFGVTWYNLSRDEVLLNTVPSLTKTLFVPEFRYVHDDVLMGLYGPRKGSRYYFKLMASPNILDNNSGFYSLKTDVRNYQPLNDYMGFAFRASGGASFGRNPQSFYLGGTENWINASFRNNRLPFNDPEDFAFMNIEMPLRGFPIGNAIGSKFFVANAEFRFPLLQALVAGPLPILIQGVMGNLFLDVGGAWDDTFRATTLNEEGDRVYDDLMLSTGLGIRSYMLGLPIKLDIAWVRLYDNWTTPQYLFSLGFDF